MDAHSIISQLVLVLNSPKLMRIAGISRGIERSNSIMQIFQEPRKRLEMEKKRETSRFFKTVRSLRLRSCEREWRERDLWRAQLKRMKSGPNLSLSSLSLLSLFLSLSLSLSLGSASSSLIPHESTVFTSIGHFETQIHSICYPVSGADQSTSESTEIDRECKSGR